jgi:hypothetical protein
MGVESVRSGQHEECHGGADGEWEDRSGERYYTYNQGKPGWVEAQLINGRLSCLHYWDRVDCRQLGQGLGKQLEDEARYEASHPPQRTESAPDTHQEPWPGYCDSAWQSKSMFWGLAGCGQ